jgi:hypothetical protein
MKMKPAVCTPLQQIKRVYGLGTDASRNLDLTLIDYSLNLSLAAMDAPDALPAGSMVDLTLIDYSLNLSLAAMDAPDALPAGSMVSDDSYDISRICERVTFRDYRPEWRQGGEAWENGRRINRMRDMQP